MLIATEIADAKVDLPFGDETDMRPMPSPQNVLSVAGIVLFEQKAKPRSGGARQQRGVGRRHDLPANDPGNLLSRLR